MSRLLALLLVTLVACRSVPPGDRAAALAIRVRNAHLEECFRKGDLDALSAVYAPEAVLLSGGDHHSGPGAARAYWADFATHMDPFVPGERDWQLDVHSIEAHAMIAHQRGRSTLVYMQDGKERRSVVEFVAVWKLVDGVWRIAVDAWWPATP